MIINSNFAFKIAAKPLQIEIWLLLTTHRNHSRIQLYFVDPYDLPFSHNTCVTDRQPRQQTEKHEFMCQKSRQLYGWPKKNQDFSIRV